MAKEMERDRKSGNLSLKEKLIGKRYRNAERRVYNRFKNKQKNNASYGSHIMSAEFNEYYTRVRRGKVEKVKKRRRVL